MSARVTVAAALGLLAAWVLWAPSVALGEDPNQPLPIPGDGDGSDTNPVCCCRGGCSSLAANITDPFDTCMGPIRLENGAVTELETDLSLSGPAFGWTHRRTYSSRLKEALPHIQGNKWMSDVMTTFIHEAKSQDGTDDVTLYIDATAARTYHVAANSDPNGSPVTYAALRDSDTSLMHYKPPSDIETDGEITDIEDPNTNTRFTCGLSLGADHGLVGCLVRVLDANGKEAVREIVDNDANSIQVSPGIASMAVGQQFRIGGQFVYTLKASGQIFKFKDCNLKHTQSTWEENCQGVAYVHTDRGGVLHDDYTFDNSVWAGRITQVVISNEYTAEYEYQSSITNKSRMRRVTVKDTSGRPVMGVLYAMADGYGFSQDCGPGTSLALAVVCRTIKMAGTVNYAGGTTISNYTPDRPLLADNAMKGCKIVVCGDGSDAFQTRTIEGNTSTSITVSSAFITTGEIEFWVVDDLHETHYRYYGDNDPNGLEGQLKAVYEPEAIQAMIGADPNNIRCGYDLLSIDDTTSIGSKALRQYASRSFTYYTEDPNLSSKETPWSAPGTEDLLGRYGGVAPDSVSGFVKSETISTACGGCGGASGLEHTYFYMNTGNDPNSGNTPATAVTRIVVEDSTAQDPNDTTVKVSRDVYGLNKYAAELRHARIVDPNSPKHWCTSTLVGTVENENRITERRMASAHTCVTEANNNIDEFLNPTGNGGANDSNTLGDSGLIYVSEFTTDGYVASQRVKNGKNGTLYYADRTVYGDPNNASVPNYLPSMTWTYRYDTTEPNSPNVVQYTYAFWSNDPNRIQVKTATYSTVDPNYNGWITATVTSKEYYDEQGRLRWSLGRRGALTYYSYHPQTGGLALQVVDVDPNSIASDSDFTGTGGEKWVAWGNSLPAGFARDPNLPAAAVIKTKYEYDPSGRQFKVHDPVTTTYTVYVGNQTRVYPAWDTVSNKPLLPVQVTTRDDAGRMVESYSFDPNNGGVTIGLTDTNEPTGVDTDPNSAWKSLTRWNYDDKGMLASLDRYYDIAGAHKLTTQYEYDPLSRPWKVVDPDGVTITQYDLMGRVKETWRGSDPNETTYYDPNHGDMRKLSETYYDDADPNTPLVVGDGNATLVMTYTGAGAYYASRQRYDFRGRLLRTLGQDGVLSVHDPLATVTDWTYAGVSSIDVDPNTISSSLRAKQTSSYDELDRAYKVSVYSVDPNGTVGETPRDENYWYDAEGNRIKTQTPDGLMTKVAFDGAGRTTLSAVCSGEGANTDPDKLTNDDIMSVTIQTYDPNAGGRPYQTQSGTSEANVVTVSTNWYDISHNGTGALRPYLTGVSSVKANTDPSETVLTEYEYDGAGRLATTVLPAPDGSSSATKVTQAFDDLGRVTTTQTYKVDGAVLLSQSGREFSATTGQLTSEKVYKVLNGTSDPNAFLDTFYTYDSLGRVSKVTAPSGSSTQTLYNWAGQVTGSYLCSDDPNTVVEQTLTSYDPNTGYAYLVRQYRRNDGSSAVGELDPNSARVSYSAQWHDDLGRTRKSIFYGTNGGTAIVDPNSDYDPNVSGTQIYSSGSIPDPNSSNLYIVTAYTYTGFGQANTVTDNKGHVTRYYYDDPGRRTHVVEGYYDPSSTLDPNSPPSRAADVNRVTKFVYDQGRLLKQIAVDPNCDGSGTADDQETVYTYSDGSDPNDCPVPRTDIVISVKYGDDPNEVQFTYYANGAMRTRTDQRGVVHAYTYDDLNRLMLDGATVPSGVADDTVQSIKRTYDDWGRVVHVGSYSDPNGTGTVLNDILLGYEDPNTGGDPNGWGSLTASYQNHSGAADANSPSVKYGYEATTVGSGKNLRLRSMTYPTSSRVVYYSYSSSDPNDAAINNAINRVGILAADPNNSTKYAEYAYVGAGTMVRLTYPSVTSGGNALNLSYGTSGSYFGLDRLDRIVYHIWRYDTPSIVDDYAYEYDRNSNRTRKTMPSSGNKYYAYFYDGLDRLDRDEAWRGTMGRTPQVKERTWEYNLDGVGNWTRYIYCYLPNNVVVDQNRQHNKTNEITDGGTPPNGITENTGSAVWIDPAYDAAGNMTAGPKAGSETTKLKYVYDAWNRMVKVKDPNDVVKWEYWYDGLNRRIKKVDDTQDPNVTWHYYYNDNWQIVEVRKDDDTDPYDQYVWGTNYVDAPVCRYRDGNTDGDYADAGVDDNYYFTYDANFNVTSLVGAERYLYTAYGQVYAIYDWNWSTPLSWSNSKKNEILFCGYRYDPETGNYHVRNRMYNPALGRWFQRDPIVYPDGMSLYEYCRSGPVRGPDPLGLAKFEFDWNEYRDHPEQDIKVHNEYGDYKVGTMIWRDGEYWIKPYNALDNMVKWNDALKWISGPHGEVCFRLSDWNGFRDIDSQGGLGEIMTDVHKRAKLKSVHPEYFPPASDNTGQSCFMNGITADEASESQHRYERQLAATGDIEVGLLTHRNPSDPLNIAGGIATGLPYILAEQVVIPKAVGLVYSGISAVSRAAPTVVKTAEAIPEMRAAARLGTNCCETAAPIGTVAGEMDTIAVGQSMSTMRLTQPGETFLRYESGNPAFSRVTSGGGLSPGTCVAPSSEGLLPQSLLNARYNLPSPGIPRVNVFEVAPPPNTWVIGPKPVMGGTGYEAIFPYGTRGGSVGPVIQVPR